MAFNCHESDPVYQKFFQFLKQKICQVYTNYPVEFDVLDYYIDLKLKRFRNWDNMMGINQFQFKQQYHNIFISTTKTI